MIPIRILILEDDEDIIDLLRSVLEPYYECFTAGNGMEGLQQAAAGQPDLIICDIMMPVMDGWEFMRRLRLQSDFNNIPVIFLSALSKSDHIRDGYSLGAALYFTKPINPTRFKRNIDLFIEENGVIARPKKKRIHQLKFFGMEADPPVAEPSRPVPATQPQTESTARPVHKPMAVPLGPPPGYAQSMAPGPASVTAEIKAQVSRTEAKKHGNEKPRVLVVEDDQDLILLMYAGLGEDYEFLDATDGMMAIERAVRYKPDIFVIDGMLPKMTGYQLTAMLKKNREFYRAPIIFISGKASQRDQQYAQQLGVSHFLPKPFTVGQMVKILQEIISQPSFSIHKGRVDYSQISLEQFQHHETHRTSMPPSAMLDTMEKKHLENVLKKQLRKG